jgi:hypothetical protein
MSGKTLGPAIASVVALALAATPVGEAASALFGGGPFYSGGSATMNALRASGFNTIVLWSVHVRSNGDLVLNDQRVVAEGAYVGNPDWPAQLASLKQAPTAINRIELSVGSFGVNDFRAIRDLIATQGTGESSILNRNFRALQAATGADAVDFDEETLYDVPSAVRFGVMLADLGLRVTLCPYTNVDYWTAVRTQILAQRPGAIDRIYLQVYAGGAGNDPSAWNRAFGSTVDPGVWVRHGTGCAEGDSPATIQSKMASWIPSAGITGGFLWYYDDMLRCPSGGTVEQYAQAVNHGLGMAPAPTPTASPTPPSLNLARDKPATGTATCAASERPPKAVNGSVSGGNSDKWCSSSATRWLQVDLLTRRDVGRFVVKHAGAGGESRSFNTRAFNIQVSDDATSWTTVVTVSNNTANVTTHTIAPRAARFVRLNVTRPTQTSNSAARIYELEVYGTSGP